MTEQTTETYLQPDPAWDYYDVWITLHQVKDIIDKALDLMKIQEYANSDCDIEVHQHLVATVEILQSIDLGID